MGMFHGGLCVSPCILASSLFGEKMSMRHTALSAHRVSPDFSPDFFLASDASISNFKVSLSRDRGIIIIIIVRGWNNNNNNPSRVLKKILGFLKLRFWLR